jgi:hypothetical protein
MVECTVETLTNYEAKVRFGSDTFLSNERVRRCCFWTKWFLNMAWKWDTGVLKKCDRG